MPGLGRFIGAGGGLTATVAAAATTVYGGAGPVSLAVTGSSATRSVSTSSTK